MKKLVLVGLASVVLAACNGQETETVPQELSEPEGTPALEQLEMGLEDAVTPDEISAELNELRNSGVTGDVMLTETEGEEQTRVVVTLDQVQTTNFLPATIRLGECNTPGAMVYNLEPVTDGTSTTLLSTALQPLLDRADELSVVLGQSDQAADTYVACAEID